ncbi:hypothetical protein SEF58_01255, partial [Neomoorella humiferrea]|uniref:hypothetical protein n=1 Tax=Neomoorella humiferrea TaxID=676965 RepID=UPI003D946028
LRVFSEEDYLLKLGMMPRWVVFDAYAVTGEGSDQYGTAPPKIGYLAGIIGSNCGQTVTSRHPAENHFKTRFNHVRKNVH